MFRKKINRPGCGMEKLSDLGGEGETKEAQPKPVVLVWVL